MTIQEFIENHPLHTLSKSYLSISVHAEIIEGDELVDEECKTLFEQSRIKYKDAMALLLENPLTSSQNITDEISHKIYEGNELLKTAVQLLPEEYVNKDVFFNLLGEE